MERPALRRTVLALISALAFGVATPLVQRFGRGGGPPLAFAWGPGCDLRAGPSGSVKIGGEVREAGHEHLFG